VKIEIKSEKNGSNSSSNSDISNQMPNEQDNNNNAENLVCKPIEKLSASVPSSSENSSSSQPLPSKEANENTTGTDYSMKTFMEHQQRDRDGIKLEQNAKSEKSPEVKPHHPFGIVDRDEKMPTEHPPGMLRHPYEPLMMKYDLPPHPAMDLKYLPPEHPARAFAENAALKSHFSADNLINKGSYPSEKYPSDQQQQSAQDVSRVTPNQDSQGSNSNSQPATLPSPSPLTSSAPSTVSSSHPSVVQQPPPSSLFVSHPGLMSAHHPSLLGGPPLSAASLVSTSSPFLPIPSGLPRPDPIPSTATRSTFSSSGLTTSSVTTSSISSAGSAFGPGGSSLYSRGNESNGRDGIPHRSSPLGPLLHGAPHPLLSHPLPLHLGHPGLAGIPPHHLPPHLHNHLMQPLGGPNTPLPLIGGPQGPQGSNPLSSLIEAAGRRTPTSATSIGNHIGQSPQQPPSSHHNSIVTSSSAGSALNVSSLSRSSPLVHPSSSGAFTHRPQSPSSNHPANLSRNSPLHLGAGQPVGPSPAAINAERERQLLRQQSPHMTPPPPSSSASSLVASPLSKM
jgi:arginine-glutamic acid dipeptide repeat-containing protein